MKYKNISIFLSCLILIGLITFSIFTFVNLKSDNISIDEEIECGSIQYQFKLSSDYYLLQSIQNAGLEPGPYFDYIRRCL